MNELKAYNVVATADVNPEVVDNLGCTEWPAYDKSEADKVIAELEERHKMEVEQLLMEIAELKADYDEVRDRLQTANLIKDEQLAATRHQKYKRCLGLKEICLMELDNAFRDPCIERSAVKCVLWRKWANRWHYLAQFFKEDHMDDYKKVLGDQIKKIIDET